MRCQTVGVVRLRARRNMRQRMARFCLDCEEIHQDEWCPSCASKASVYLTGWIPQMGPGSAKASHARVDDGVVAVDGRRETRRLFQCRASCSRSLCTPARDDHRHRGGCTSGGSTAVTASSTAGESGWVRHSPQTVDAHPKSQIRTSVRPPLALSIGMSRFTSPEPV
jgi:hypothetical protein